MKAYMGKTKIIILLLLALLLSIITGCSTDTNDYLLVTGGPDGLSTVKWEHHEIHEGEHYYISGFETEADGGTIIFGVTTPNTTEYAHMTLYIEGTSRTELLVYEGATVTGGAAQTPINNNRNSLNTSSVSIVKDPTVNATGTLIFSQSAGLEGATPNSGNSDGLFTRGRELILKSNTTYTFNIISRDADNIITYIGEWYEHTFE